MKINGFTILEILTATVIFSIIVSFIYVGYFNIQDATKVAVDQQKRKIEFQQLVFSIEKDFLMADKIEVDSMNYNVIAVYGDSTIQYSFQNELGQVYKVNREDTVQSFAIQTDLNKWGFETVVCENENFKILNHINLTFIPFEGQELSKDFYKNTTVKMKYDICVANGF